jgi:hypothetical protein
VASVHSDCLRRKVAFFLFSGTDVGAKKVFYLTGRTCRRLPLAVMNATGRTVWIREQPGTPAFLAAYTAALEALEAPPASERKGPKVAPAGSLGWLGWLGLVLCLHGIKALDLSRRPPAGQ